MITVKEERNPAGRTIAETVEALGWKLHRWATIRCGNSSDLMLGFWCWVLDRLEATFGEPPDDAFHSIVDAWCETDHDEE